MHEKIPITLILHIGLKYKEVGIIHYAIFLSKWMHIATVSVKSTEFFQTCVKLE